MKQNPRFASKDDGISGDVFCYAKKREAAEMSPICGGDNLAQTRYREEYCNKVINFFMDYIRKRGDPNVKMCNIGYPSMVRFADSIGVTPRTIRNWRKSHDDFDEACNIADEIQDEVLNEMGLFGDADGKVAMKIRELKLNNKRDDESSCGAKLVINLNDDKGAERIEIKKWVGEINEDTEY